MQVGIGGATPAVSSGDLDQVIDNAVAEGAGEVVGAAVATIGLAAIASEFIGGLEKGLEQSLGSLLQGNQPACNPPTPVDAQPPQGALQSDPSKNTVTTPGGYKVTLLGQYHWEIVGPDGKKTDVNGDPHVTGKTKWDFQKDSSFVLGDGTKIDVTTAAYGSAGARVTSSLQIISGNDRVVMGGIDGAKGGTTSGVSQDGFQHVNDAGGEPVFVEGQESDDWGFQGKEITGGSTLTGLKLGQAMAPLTDVTTQNGGGSQWAEQLAGAVLLFAGMQMLFNPADNPYSRYPTPPANPNPAQPQKPQNWMPLTPRDGLHNAFRDLGHLFDTLAAWTNVSAAAGRRVFA